MGHGTTAYMLQARLQIAAMQAGCNQDDAGNGGNDQYGIHHTPFVQSTLLDRPILALTCQAIHMPSRAWPVRLLLMFYRLVYKKHNMPCVEKDQRA